MKLFDAHLGNCPDVPESSTVHKLALHLDGAIAWGSGSAAWRKALSIAAPAKHWRHAESVSSLIGPDDPRFPQSNPEVLDLDMNDAELLRWLQAPLHAWFPLLETYGHRRALHLKLPHNGGPIPLIKKLIRGFPRTLFIVDPFRHGPNSGWVPQVRLAESNNVRVTTVGLTPGSACVWPLATDIAAAFHYVAGEVGVGKLLFASGETPLKIVENASSEWLASIPTLDADQRELVAHVNAEELMGLI
jgi:hypothetical protein